MKNNNFKPVLVYRKAAEAQRLRQAIDAAKPLVEELAFSMQELNLPLRTSDLIPIATDVKSWISNTLPIPDEALVVHGLRMRRAAFIDTLDFGDLFVKIEALKKLSTSLFYFEVDEDYKVHIVSDLEEQIQKMFFVYTENTQQNEVYEQYWNFCQSGMKLRNLLKSKNLDIGIYNIFELLYFDKQGNATIDPQVWEFVRQRFPNKENES